MDKGNIALQYPVRHVSQSRKGYLREGGGKKSGGLQDFEVVPFLNFLQAACKRSQNETSVSSALRAQSPPESSQPSPSSCIISHSASSPEHKMAFFFFFFFFVGCINAEKLPCEDLLNTGAIVQVVQRRDKRVV